MNREIRLQLEPTGHSIAAAVGAPLQDVLCQCGVEFPCGGRGTCGKCRVQVVQGRLDPCQKDFLLLGREAVEGGWRLACCGRADHDVTLRLAQWDTEVLLDETSIHVSPRNGWGIAIDLGTTTVAGQLVDLRSGHVLAVRSGLNPQAGFGADIMSRVHYGVTDGGDGRLTRLIRQYLGSMVGELLQEAAGENVPLSALQEIAIVGNTVMHHIFCGHDLSSLARCPFETPHLAEHRFTSRELDWAVAGAPLVRFLPCIGGFIGSDLLAGMVATRIDQTPQLQVLVDLGTNGEIVVAGAQEILCAATAAGPAFEGARIQMGMRASCGAIDRVSIAELNDYRELQCHVIGGGAPTGICGSGLIDAAACALELGKLAPNGRLIHGSDRLQLAGSVFLHQCDFRELQLAKGAIAAGLEILLSRLGNAWEDVEDVFICGAFGNYLAVDNARRLGLLPFPVEKVVAMGNTALLGSKLALLTGDDFTGRVANIYRRVEQVGLSENKGFMDVYIRHMPFPAG